MVKWLNPIELIDARVPRCRTCKSTSIEIPPPSRAALLIQVIIGSAAAGAIGLLIHDQIADHATIARLLTALAHCTGQ